MGSGACGSGAAMPACCFSGSTGGAGTSTASIAHVHAPSHPCRAARCQAHSHARQRQAAELASGRIGSVRPDRQEKNLAPLLSIRSRRPEPLRQIRAARRLPTAADRHRPYGARQSRQSATPRRRPRPAPATALRALATTRAPPADRCAPAPRSSPDSANRWPRAPRRPCARRATGYRRTSRQRRRRPGTPRQCRLPRPRSGSRAAACRIHWS